MAITPQLFVDPLDVAKRMQINLQELPGAVDILTSAIVGAQLHCQTVLGSQLPIQAQDCKFYLDGDAFSGVQPNGQFRLEMPSGFIRVPNATYPLTITSDSQWSMPNPLTVDPTVYRVDYTKGIVYIDATTFKNFVINSPLLRLDVGQQYRDQYVRVQCTTGFLVNSGVWGTAGKTPPEAIPDWFTEAIIAYCAVIAVGGQAQTDNKAKEIYKVAGDHANLVLASNRRQIGFALRPM